MKKKHHSGNDWYFSRMQKMPPLSHWPDRPKPYQDENSEVLAYIISLNNNPAPMSYHRALELMNQASKKGVISFDKETKHWHGNTKSFSGVLE